MNKKESEILELKKSTSELKEAIISISSILNKHQKGNLYFGIKNDGMVIGQSVSEKTIRDISKSISDHIEPKIYPKINTVVMQEKNCIFIEFQGNNVPYYAYGRSYMRVGDEDKKLSAKEIETLILQKNKDKMRWDVCVCKNATIEDISIEKLKTFLKLSELKYDTLKNTLEKLKLSSNNKLLNYAIILFGKKPQSFFSSAKLRCAVFGTNNTSFTIDMNDFEGDLFYLINMAESYILKNIHIGMRLNGLRRIDVPEINKEALREAIINAFCHRDYWEYDSVNIAIFKNRVEIRNPGKLYDELTIDEIIKENVSKRRNELIADMFNKVHFVEKWGHGIERILSREPKTEFKELAGMFVAVFKRKDISFSDEKVTEKVTENQKQIIKCAMSNPHITVVKLADIVGISERKIKENIRKLKEKGFIKRIGPDKGGHWEVV